MTDTTTEDVLADEITPFTDEADREIDDYYRDK